MRREGETACNNFLNLSPPTSWKTISFQNVKCRRVSHARHVYLTLHAKSQVINVSVDVNYQNWLIIGYIYQELVNQNEALKVMLTGSLPASPQSPRSFCVTFPPSALFSNRHTPNKNSARKSLGKMVCFVKTFFYLHATYILLFVMCHHLYYFSHSTPILSAPLRTSFSVKNQIVNTTFHAA